MGKRARVMVGKGYRQNLEPYLLIAAFPTELPTTPSTPSTATRAIAAAVASTAAIAVALRRIGGGRVPLATVLLATFHAEPAHALLACAAVAEVREGRVVGAVVADGAAAGCRSGVCACVWCVGNKCVM